MNKPTDRDQVEMELGMAVMMAIREAVASVVQRTMWEEGSELARSSSLPQAMWDSLAREIQRDRERVLAELQRIQKDMQGVAMASGLMGATVTGLEGRLSLLELEMECLKVRLQVMLPADQVQ